MGAGRFRSNIKKPPGLAPGGFEGFGLRCFVSCLRSRLSTAGAGRKPKAAKKQNGIHAENVARTIRRPSGGAWANID
jgi:hypothetical protein